VRIPIIIALVSAYVATAATPSHAQRTWDAERYSGCLQVEGEDELAPHIIIRSINCRSGRDPIVDREGEPGDVTMIASVAGAVHKDHPEASFVSIAIATRTVRTDTAIGGQRVTSDRAGPLNFYAGYALVAGQRVELQIARGRPSSPQCSTMRRGVVSGRSCTYSEGVAFRLPAEALAELHTQYTADPSAQFRMRLATRSGHAFTIEIPAAEIEAVRQAVTTATGRFAQR
jgi:hypothetical protein